MQVGIETVSAGSYTGEIPAADFYELGKVLGTNNAEAFLVLKAPTGDILLNKANIVSIVRKR